MARNYIKTNNSKTKDLFEKRMAYKIRMAQSSYKNLVNFNFGEKYMYGRVDRLFVPMMVNEDRRPIKKFDRSLVKARGLGALPFVVDAFNDLAQQFRKCALTNKIDTSDPFLTNLKVHQAYISPTQAYGRYRKTYFATLAKAFRSQGIKVRNFDEFLSQLTLMLGATARRNPFTKTAFIKSRHAPPGCSGLVIEIANLNAANDQAKIDQFVNSNNWEFYLNACASYGFMVDRNVPWRLVADIGIYPEKSAMIAYAVPYGLDTTNKIINRFYKEVYTSYYPDFKRGLLDLYNQVKRKSFLITEECGGSTVSVRVQPDTYTLESLFEKYSEEDFLRIYFQIRFLEEESVFTENQKSLMIDDCIELYLQSSLGTSLGSFARIINKTFDYRGSLSYIKKHLDAVKAASFEEGPPPTLITMGPLQGY